jgi:hypothetical protein
VGEAGVAGDSPKYSPTHFSHIRDDACIVNGLYARVHDSEGIVPHTKPLPLLGVTARMHIPLSGIVFLTVTALVFLFRPSRLEELLIYMAVFQGAAVLNLGGAFTVGLSPFFLAASLLALRVCLKWTTGRIRFHRGEFTQHHLAIASFFFVWCVVSAFLLPILFDGIPVDSPRAGAEAVFYLRLPLHWGLSNAGQAGYMMLDFVVLLAFVDFCAGRPLEDLMAAFTYSGVIVVVVGLYQMMAHRFGFPFPASFFNSNATWGQNYDQMIGSGWHRVSATFVEPSGAGGFLSGWLLFELILANWGSTKRTRHWIFAILGCVVLLATTSSTGYMTVAFVLAFMSGRIILEAFGRGRILIRTGAATATVVLVGIAFLAVGHDTSLLDAVLWHKADSSSAIFRSATAWRALSVMQETYGLGAGLGSNRAFGTLAYIGSNLGIFGLIVFSIMLIHLFAEVFSSLRIPSASSPGRVALIACTAAYAGNLIGMAISGAEISEPRIWILWGMLLASVRVQIGDVPCQRVETTGLSPADLLYPRPILG